MKNHYKALFTQVLFEIKHRKMPYVLGTILVLGHWGPLALTFFLKDSFSIQESTIAKTSLSFFHVIIFFGMAVSSFYASRLIEQDIFQKVISAILVRPIHRSTYLISRGLGVCFIFFLFVFLAVASHLTVHFVSLGGLPESPFELGVIQHLFLGFSMIFLAIAMGTIFSSASVIASFIFAWLFLLLGGSLPIDFHWSIYLISTFLHYVFPVGIPIDLLSGVIVDLSPEDIRTHWLEILDNLLYGGCFLWLAIQLFTWRDVPLKEKV